MSDSSWDEYLEDPLPDLYSEDPLPDLVLSSSYPKEDLQQEDSLEYYLPPDLLPGLSGEDNLDLEKEYFTLGDQISSSYGAEGVRVSYTDHSKPYQPRISGSDAYRSYLNLTASEEEEISLEEDDLSLRDGGSGRQVPEWREDLRTTEKEIQNVRKEILVKVRYVNQLKSQLGTTAWREFSTDFKEGWRRLHKSQVFVKMEETVADIGGSIDGITDIFKKDPNLLKPLQDLQGVKEKVSMDLQGVTEKLSKEIILVKKKAAVELQGVKEKAVVELHGAQRKTSQSLTKLQSKASAVLRPPDHREYREEDRIDTAK